MKCIGEQCDFYHDKYNACSKFTYEFIKKGEDCPIDEEILAAENSLMYIQNIKEKIVENQIG